MEISLTFSPFLAKTSNTTLLLLLLLLQFEVVPMKLTIAVATVLYDALAALQEILRIISTKNANPFSQSEALILLCTARS